MSGSVSVATRSLGDLVPACVPLEPAWGALRECLHRLLVLRHWGRAECSGDSQSPSYGALSSDLPAWGCTKPAALTLTPATHIPAVQSKLLQC